MSRRPAKEANASTTPRGMRSNRLTGHAGHELRQLKLDLMAASGEDGVMIEPWQHLQMPIRKQRHKTLSKRRRGLGVKRPVDETNRAAHRAGHIGEILADHLDTNGPHRAGATIVRTSEPAFERGN